MKKFLKIQAASSKPKYEQIIEGILAAIESGTLKRGQQLPSIAELADEQHLAKATVARSYDTLCEKGILMARHGKGFYVSKTSVKTPLNIFLLFDTFNQYKEILYRSFREALPAAAQCSIFFHHYNREVFDNLISDSAGKYTHYVIVPHFEEGISATLGRIPPEKLLVLDQYVPRLHARASNIYQPFEKDVLTALAAAKEDIRKYNRLHVILGRSHFQYIPSGILSGFRKFVKKEQIAHSIESDLLEDRITQGDAYLIFSDGDMIGFVKYAQARKLKIGRDIGMISYDDTPLKGVLLNGVSVISTDFQHMGKAAANAIVNREIVRIENPGSFIKRRTL